MTLAEIFYAKHPRLSRRLRRRPDRRRVPVLFEPLEPRLLLSGDSFLLAPLAPDPSPTLTPVLAADSAQTSTPAQPTTTGSQSVKGTLDVAGQQNRYSFSLSSD